MEKKAKQEQAAAAAAPPPKAKDKKVKKPAAIDAYDPKKVEAGRYDWWQSQRLFEPRFTEGQVNDKGRFVISMPPPNVTGSLHMGHALMIALQDTMIRRARMMGLTTLWVPGLDHAGISTQR
jgi:valyl-tRNA synthetase